MDYEPGELEGGGRKPGVRGPKTKAKSTSQPLSFTTNLSYFAATGTDN